MRIWMLGIGLAFVSVSLSCAQAKELSESDFAVLKRDSNVRLALSVPIEEVVKSLGLPLATKVKKSDQEPRYIQYVFKGLTVGFSEQDQKVALLRITGPEFTTSRHLSVGATLEQVKSAYGPVKKEWPTVIQYQLKDASSRLGVDYLVSFWTKGSVVTGIDINRAP